MSMNPELIALNKEIDLNDPEKLSISFSVRTEDGEVKSGSFDSTSLNFDAVATLVESYIDGNMERDVLGIALLSMSRPIEQVKERFRKIEGLLNGRVTTNDSTVLIDYDKIDPALEAHILRLLKGGLDPDTDTDWVAFSRFLDKLYSNTSENVRSQFFGWAATVGSHENGFTLTEDGDLIAYKGVHKDEKGTFWSSWSGTAYVDGEKHQGQIPNPIGSVIEMPRSEVSDDPSSPCSVGLHVGSYRFANSWGEHTLMVQFSPAAIVSVPSDSAHQKIRVHRYKVLREVKTKEESPTLGAETNTAVDTENFEVGDHVSFIYNGVTRQGRIVDGIFYGPSGDYFTLEDETNYNAYKNYTISRISGLVIEEEG